MISELESDLRNTLDKGKKWLVDFNARKIRLVSYGLSNDAGAIDVKTDGFFLSKNHLLRFWVCLSLLNWIGIVT